ncbi:MAG: CHAD domain-containing protein [Pseudomonadota bacterium]
MAFALSYDDLSIAAGMRRVAQSQIASGLRDLSDDSLNQNQVVLAVRKRCKKLRGLVRLFQEPFPDYQDENSRFRDLARKLSDARESTALLDALDRLSVTFSDELDEEIFLPLRERLLAQRRHLTETYIASLLNEAATVFMDSQQRIQTWHLTALGADAFETGLMKTYQRARRLMAEADASRDVETIHEWRKHTKYHWHHLRLIRACWPPVMAGYLSVADKMAKALGEHHDLALLKTHGAALLCGDHQPVFNALNAAASLRQVEIEEHAFRYGRKLFSERPTDAARRYANWWSAGRAQLG